MNHVFNDHPARVGLTLIRDEEATGAYESGHRHAWELETSKAGLETAQASLGWDVAASRIIGVNKCRLCGGLHRGSVRECRLKRCRTHPICERAEG